mgnify:CR=1 FL=1
MKATELRIGNWANNGERDYVLDRSSIQDVINFSEDDYTTDWLPIPLTEEWLKRCDWENRKDKDLAVSFGLTSGKVHFVCGNYYTECDTVHHFQNLYHALTGQELELKSEQ